MCELIRIVRPCRWMIWISDSRKSRRTTVSRPSVGSSRINSSGSGATASASETWARWPLREPADLGSPRQGEVIEDLVEQLAVPVRIEGPREADGFLDRHPAEEGMPFGDVGDAGPRGRRQRGDVLAQQLRRAAVGPHQAQQHLERRRFARAVASQQAVDRALRHAQVERVDDAAAAVVFGESLGDDRVGHRISSPPAEATENRVIRSDSNASTSSEEKPRCTASVNSSSTSASSRSLRARFVRSVCGWATNTPSPGRVLSTPSRSSSV